MTKRMIQFAEEHLKNGSKIYLFRITIKVHMADAKRGLIK
jgi:hypothetical protein